MSVYKNENPVYFLEAVESVFHQTVIPKMANLQKSYMMYATKYKENIMTS